MGPTPISAGFLLSSLGFVLLLEVVTVQLGAWMNFSRLWIIGLSRTFQLAAVIALTGWVYGNWQALGLDKRTCLTGIKKGFVWSAGFAVIAGLLLLTVFIAGQNPLMLIRTPLPSAMSQRVLYFIVGGVLAPITEEVVFRGLIFGYLRRWGAAVAVLVSTALFAGLHLPSIPVTQVVGGLVFAIAYHMSGNLLVPIVIHSLGNLAIFTLSLPFFYHF